MKQKTKYWVAEGIAAMMILLFTYTAISKIIDHPRFLEVLNESPLLSQISNIVSWGIPFVEILITVLLLVPAVRNRGLFLSFLFMTLFTIYIAYMLLFTPALPCSCGGIISTLSWNQHLALNIFLTFASFAAWRMEQNHFFIAINRTSRTPVKESRRLIN